MVCKARFWSPDKSKMFSVLQKKKKARHCLVIEQPSIRWVARFLPWDKEEEAWSWPLTSQAPKLGMSGSTLLLPLYPFMVWTGTALLFANTMQQSASWQHTSSSPTSEIFHTVWNSKIHFRIQNSGKDFLFSKASKPALRPTQPPVVRVLRVPSPGIKRPEHKSDHSHPFSSKIQYTWRYTPTQPYTLMA
jgi:hypothetical protein